MSLIPIGVTIAAAAVLELLSPVFFRPRNIAGFIADVTIKEDHDDELAVVDHPVEQGAAITDHSFKRPARLTVTVGYSTSSFQAEGDPNYVPEIYQQFLALQASRQPFDVLTGKRAYTNMLMTRLRTETDEKTENSMILTCEMRQIILVTTQAVTVPNQANMANPQANAATQTQGTKALTTAPNFNAAAAP